MRKTTFEQRMKTYMIMVILVGAFLTLSTGFMWLTTHSPAASVSDLPVIEKIDAAPLLSIDELETVAQLSTINPDSYGGKIILATAKEVITMQIIDGIKHFTNHSVG